jgi:transposase-like protein
MRETGKAKKEEKTEEGSWLYSRKYECPSCGRLWNLRELVNSSVFSLGRLTEVSATEYESCPYCKKRMRRTNRKGQEENQIEFECHHCGGVWNYSEGSYYPVYYPTVIANGLASATKEARKKMRKLGKEMI